MKLSEILSNPARMKILQYLGRAGEGTTKQISEAIPEIPSPTLYRHINFLLKEEVLKVKEERKVRGSVERLLTVNTKKLADETDIADASYQFLMSLYGSFQRYSEKESPDPVADMLCMRTAMFTLTDESFRAFLMEIAALFEKYSKTEEGGKNRSVSIVSAPVFEGEDQ